MDEKDNLRLAPEIRRKSFCQSVKGEGSRYQLIVDTSPNHLKAEIDRIKPVSQMGSNPKAFHIVAQAYSIGRSKIHHGSA